MPNRYPGRNDPCPCGSGKKHKACCLPKKAKPASGATPITPPVALQADLSQTHQLLNHGFLRTNGITITFTYAEPQPTFGYEADPRGYPGNYEVEFTLRRPAGSILAEPTYDPNPGIVGDSLLQIANPIPRKPVDIASIKLDIVFTPSQPAAPSQHIQYAFLPNDEGFLATIKTQVHAQNSLDAEKIATRNLKPILAEWSFIHDVPLDIFRIRIEETLTKTSRIVYQKQAYKQVALNTARYTGNRQIPQQYHALAFYQEAQSATSPFYQYLCFFKVIELVLGLRDQRVEEVKASGGSPLKPVERLVDDLWLTENIDADILADAYRKKKYTRIADEILNPMRVRIAHAFLGKEGPTGREAADLLDPEEVFRLLPLAKYIAKKLAAAELGLPA